MGCKLVVGTLLASFLKTLLIPSRRQEQTVFPHRFRKSLFPRLVSWDAVDLLLAQAILLRIPDVQERILPPRFSSSRSCVLVGALLVDVNAKFCGYGGSGGGRDGTDLGCHETTCLRAIYADSIVREPSDFLPSDPVHARVRTVRRSPESSRNPDRSSASW